MTAETATKTETPAGPKQGTIRVTKVSYEMGAQDRLFVPAIAAGLGISIKHFFKNLLTKDKYTATIQYPDEKVVYPPRFRGMHRLVPRDDGSPRCVACFMCQTACPARCITIVAAETTDSRIEKYPEIFKIDELRCVMCGLCVEACPCDAIRMDTGIHPKPVYTREDGDFGKNDLLAIPGRNEAAGARDKAAPPATAAGKGRKVRAQGDGGAGGSLGGYEPLKTKGQPIGKNAY